MPDVVIVLPRRTRRLYAAFYVVVGLVFVAGAALGFRSGSPAALVPLAAAVLAGTAGYRFARLAVTAHDEVLEVRNILATARFDRRAIHGFTIGPHVTGGQAVRAVLATGSAVPFDVTVRPSYMRSLAKQRAWVEDLQRWLGRHGDTGARPYPRAEEEPREARSARQ
jgi:hypothetical protein